MQGMQEMTPAMAEAVLGFLREAWPLDPRNDPPRGGWDHMFSTSTQIACMALVALGQAEDAGWGASPKPEPRLPEVLPFWEDVAVAVLWLAEQIGRIEYLSGTSKTHPDRVVKSLSGKTQWTTANNRSPTTPNILAGHGTGPAFATPEVVSVFEALGLAKDGQWTPAAETVHWRGLPLGWALEFEAGARFQAAVEDTVNRLPLARREEIDRLMRVSATEVAERMSKSRSTDEQRRASSCMDQFVAPAPTADMVRRLTSMEREHALNWIFFRHWRLGRGWLDEDQAGRAFDIFHDRLAIAMRRAVVARLYPGGFVWE
jgi:hypothetical protein